MKAEIYFLNSKLTTEINKDILVKDLIDNLKEYLKLPDSNFLLFDSNYIQLNESDTISIEKEKNQKLIFYLIKECPNKEKLINSDSTENENLHNNESVHNLIMECTGAKKPLDIKAQRAINLSNRISLLEFMDNHHNNNGDHEVNNIFDGLINILQILEDGNHPTGIRIIHRPNNINDSQIEANEGYLRELQDMGFPEDRARDALINSRNDINRATELLLGEEEQ